MIPFSGIPLCIASQAAHLTGDPIRWPSRENNEIRKRLISLNSGGSVNAW